MTDRAGDNGGASAAALLLAVTILVFAPISFAYNGVFASARPPAKNDFTSYYVAGIAVREGMPEALYYPEPVGSLLAQASQQHPWIDLARSAGIENPNYYLYPPLFALLFAPVTLLPYGAAYVAWLGLGVFFLAASSWLFLSSLDAPLRSTRGMLLAAGAILTACLFYPVARNLAIGQSSLLLLLLMTGVMVKLRSRTRAGDAWAGVCLAGGILLKLTPALFLPYLALRRRWRALGYSMAALVLLMAVSIGAVGLEPHRVYFERMVPQLSGGTAFYPNQSLTGLVARISGEDLRLADLLDPAAAAARVARWLGLILMGVTLLLAVRRRAASPASPHDPDEDDRGFGLLLLAGLAASPISWEHHYVLALIPAWILMRDLSTLPGGESSRTAWLARAAVTGIALALVGSYVGVRVIELWGGGSGSAPLGQVAAASGLMGGALLWLLLATAAPRSHRPPERGPDSRPGGARVPAGLLVAMAVFCSGVFLAKLMEYNRAYAYGDFTSYYVAAATLLEGEGNTLYYPDTPDMILARATTPSPWTETAARYGVRDANYYLYPPSFAIAMMPIALLSFETAHNVWYIANLAALAACVWLLVRMGRKAPRDGMASAEIALSVMAVTLSWPALFTFGAGQANWVVLLLLLGSLAALRSGRDTAAGLMVAGAAAIKMTPALLLVYLAWRRRWRALAAAVGGLAAVGAAGLAVAGAGEHSVYLEKMVPLLSRGCAHWINESLLAFFTRLLDGGDIFSWALATPSTLSRLLTTAASLALVGAALWVVGWKSRKAASNASVDLEYSLMVVTTLFVSPLSWTHHSVLGLMAFLLAARWLLSLSLVTDRVALVMAAAYTLAHVHIKPPGIFEHGPLKLLASYNLAGNLILWGLVAWLIVKQRERARQERAVLSLQGGDVRASPPPAGARAPA